MNIPFHKSGITDAEINEVVDTLKSGWLTTGPKTRLFEQEFADYLGHRHAVAVNSCTAALHLALEAIGLNPGEAVVIPTMTFAATAEVVRYLGGVPILADCRESDFNLDVSDAERRIETALARGLKVRAIIPVHYGGQIGDVRGVAALASRYQLKIIEDAAHCCPAYYRDESGKQKSERRNGEWEETKESKMQKVESRNNTTTPHPASGRLLPRAEKEVSPAEAERASAGNGASPSHSGFSPRSSSVWLPVGSSADISCYSFYANKCITTGEGGMACTANADYADRMRIMSLHGISRDAWKRFTAEGSWYYEIIAPGFKYNLTDIAASIGLHQVRRADELHRLRTARAGQYQELLGMVEELILPRVQPDRLHAWHLYVIRLKLDRLGIDRAQFIDELRQRGIGCSVHWMPLHLHPYYRETYEYAPGDLPVAASLYREIITLPLYPDMTEGEVDYVCDSIKEIIARNLRPAAAICSR